MDQSETEELLYNAAAAQALVHGFRLGNGADQQIRGYARHAAADMARSSDNERVVDGVRAFRLLVDTMITVRKDAYRLQPDLLARSVIGEDTLTMALGKLCPGFWPFC